MKPPLVRRAATALAVFLGCLPSPVLPEGATPPAATPANPGFEEGAADRGLPEGWIGGSEGYEIAVDPDVAHGGEASVRIAALAPGLPEDSWVPLIQQIPAEPWRGKRVRLSGWLRTRDVTSGWAGLWMRVDAPIGPPLAFDNMRTRPVSETTPWTRYEVVLHVDAGASRIAYGVVLAGDGTVWADDLALEEVGTDVPTTEPEPGDR